MALDANGKKLPTGIRLKKKGETRKQDLFEIRVKRNNKSYSVYAHGITEAKKAKTELEYKLEHGTFIEKTKITFGEWFDTWLSEYKKNRVKNSTLNEYQKYYNGCLKKRLGDRKLEDIRGEHIQKLYNDLIEENYATSTIKIIATVINGCFRQAFKNGLIERNPVELAELPRATGERKGRTAMTKEQQNLFMEYAKESYLYNFFAVMLRTGMRSGEIRGLKYADIDKKNGVLHVRRTLKYIEGVGYLEDTPKTLTSKRDIPLTSEVLGLLEDQKKYWGFKIEHLDRYLFCNEKGEPLSRERVQGEINRTIKQIRKDGHDFPRITSHVFRHTFATRAIEAGMQPQVLKTILGHSSLAMTMDLYSHVLPDTKAEEMEKIANAF